MADRPDLAGRASQRASAGSGSARQPDSAGEDDEDAKGARMLTVLDRW